MNGWHVSVTEDEILIEWRHGENHVIISIDENGPGYAIKNGNGFLPGRFGMTQEFREALAEIKEACSLA